MINAVDLTIRYRQESVVQNFSFRIPKGSKCCITGPSGSGKSTLLNSILGFVKPESGQIVVSGIAADEDHICEVRSITSYLPQELNLQLESVQDLVYYPFGFRRNKKNRPEESQVLQLMTHFGLDENIFVKSLHEISGGQKQRIALISCILQNKPLLILDEPTSALDQPSVRLMIDYLFAHQNLTIVSASHNEEWVKSCNCIISLENKIIDKSQ